MVFRAIVSISFVAPLLLVMTIGAPVSVPAPTSSFSRNFMLPPSPPIKTRHRQLQIALSLSCSLRHPNAQVALLRCRTRSSLVGVPYAKWLLDGGMRSGFVGLRYVIFFWLNWGMRSACFG